MKYRNLGKSGLRVSTLGLGSGSGGFAGTADEETALQIINEALDLGVTYFDTAETYAEGRAESLYGKAFKGRRSDLIIATKFAKDRSVGPDEQRGSRTRIMKAVEGSLRRLETDYIDLYVMHEPDPDTPIEETLRALDDLVRAGKVRYIACSDFSAWELCEALWTSKAENLSTFVSAGAVYNMIYRDIERDLVPCCLSYGVGVVATMPLCQGFLTGKYQRGKEKPQDVRFSRQPQFSGPKHQDLGNYDKYFTDSNFDRLERFTSFAKERGHSVSELALAWLLSRPGLSAVPLGASRPGQFEQNLAALDWTLSEDEQTELDGLF